ncbi:MAG: hypothetical protein ACQKBY_01870 [Verrucomicrobiales bacterium]
MPKKLPSTSLDNQWASARSYHAATVQHARLTAAAAILTGWKLAGLKKELGFTGSGRRKESGNDCHFKSWPEWLEEQMGGMAKRTADHRIATYEAARTKFRKLGEERICYLLETGCPTDEEAAELKKLVHKCTDGDTVKSIFQDAGIAKLPQGSAATGGNLRGEGDKVEPTMQQLAFALFAEPSHNITRLRTHGDYEKALYALPLTSDTEDEPSLSVLEIETEALLADIRKAKAALLKQTQEQGTAKIES